MGNGEITRTEYLVSAHIFGTGLEFGECSYEKTLSKL